MRSIFRKILSLLALGSAVVVQSSCAAMDSHDKGYSAHPSAQGLIDELVAEGFEADQVKDTLARARRQESILRAMSRPAEKRLDWGGYSKIFLQPKRIERGALFWQQNAETLARAEKTYGVPAEVIVAIIGVETHFGRIMGNYRVLDALATLGFDYPRRAEFFREQLKQYFILARDEQLDMLAVKGSYAGAMGYGQFIPSSYKNFAVDFDADGQRDLLGNTTDAIGSVANYFASHGWKTGEAVVSAALLQQPVDKALINAGLKPELTLQQWAEKGVLPAEEFAPDQKATLIRLKSGEEQQFLLGLNNFYVITRYNRSRLYAMAVHQLSREIRAAYDSRRP